MAGYKIGRVPIRLPGRYAWELRNAVPLPQPVLAKGQLSLWNWEGEQP